MAIVKAFWSSGFWADGYWSTGYWPDVVSILNGQRVQVSIQRAVLTPAGAGGVNRIWHVVDNQVVAFKFRYSAKSWFRDTVARGVMERATEFFLFRPMYANIQRNDRIVIENEYTYNVLWVRHYSHETQVDVELVQ